MTWSFTDSPGTVPRDAVRLYVGDTDPTDMLVSDEVIDWALGLASNVALPAAARVARLIVVRFAREVDEAAGDTKRMKSQRAKAYMALTTELEALAGIGVGAGTSGLLVAPVVTGVSRGEMDAVAQNPDRPGSPWPEFEGELLDGGPLALPAD